MSCMEYKTVLRAEIKSLRGVNKRTAYNYFMGILGEPDEVEDYDDDDMDYFKYNGEFQAIQDYHGKKWGIDLVLKHNSDYKTYIDGEKYEKGLTISEFEGLANKLVDKFGVNKDSIRLISYDWYNGGDEPIYF